MWLSLLIWLISMLRFIMPSFLRGFKIVNIDWVFYGIHVLFSFSHNRVVLVIALKKFLNQRLLVALLVCKVLNGFFKGVEGEA
jgi:hypothetical protein